MHPMHPSAADTTATSNSRPVEQPQVTLQDIHRMVSLAAAISWTPPSTPYFPIFWTSHNGWSSLAVVAAVAVVMMEGGYAYE